MKKSTFVKLFALLMCGMLILSACSAPATQQPEESQTAEVAKPTAEPTTKPTAEPTQAPEETPQPTEEPPLSPAEKNAAAMEQYAPKVTTLENGVQVQKVPSDPFLWNTAVLNAEQRGCSACHDITQKVQEMTLSHPELWNPYNVDETIDFCYMCHSKALFIADSMHAKHLSSKEFTDTFNGSCQSCHYINSRTGAMELWDHVKYDVMMGFNTISNIQGEFTFDQDYITPTDEVYFYWENGDHRGVTPNNPVDQSVFDGWEISVEGLVDQPFTFKLTDYLDLSVTRVMKMHCQTNPPAGSYAANLEVKGIPLSAILEKAGIQANANSMDVYSDDGWVYPLPMSYVNAGNEMLLVYEINGEPLRMIHGYPVQFWGENLSAVHYCKRVAKIVFAEKAADPVPFLGFTNPIDGTYFNKPNCAIWHYTEGTIFPAGEKIVFEGFADAYDETITAVEISFDKGKTWTTFDTPDCDTTRLVHWTFAFTPEKPGSYVIKVRAVTETGLYTLNPATLMFNAK